ncbi:CDP-glycerol glycerophosphotransferase family protein [Phosphitispora sp. TUW77]|uniref:CDP-glycerol glycerophosphotransferase family protein n=1 Tax=Phosphitispora sp. TUW77 TaxID=3152361 RepID=UPI003AB44A9B
MMQWLIKEVKNKLKIKKWYQFIINVVKKAYMFSVNKVIGVQENKIVFISFGGNFYSDNPRAISEKLHEMLPDFEIVWLLNNLEKREIVPEYVRIVKNGLLIGLKELATAKFWVDNFTKPIYTYKSKEQIYIQTWHGDRGFKKVLYDSSFLLPNTRYIESDMCDLFISGSDYGDNKFRSAFRYYGQIIKSGCPRNDLLIENNENKKKVVKKNLKISGSTSVLLYAPTLRREAAKESKLQSNDIDLSLVIDALEQKTNKDWVCLVRAHSAVKGLQGIPIDDFRICDVTSYEDMSELLLVSDFLITDYSSSAGDFILLNRPVVLIQSDREDYIKHDRTFYFDIDKSPYLIAKTQEKLINLIQRMDWTTIPQNCEEIRAFYGTVESGEASKKVVEYIISKRHKESG